MFQDGEREGEREKFMGKISNIFKNILNVISKDKIKICHSFLFAGEASIRIRLSAVFC